jgi:hypothetical protein
MRGRRYPPPRGPDIVVGQMRAGIKAQRGKGIGNLRRHDCDS